QYNGGNNGSGSESDDLALSLYELDTDITFNFFGLPVQTVANADINIIEDKIINSTIDLSIEGSAPETENQTFTRNASGQITNNSSTNASGSVTNEYIISYENDRISQITYEYYEDASENYTYNFTYDNNTITRTEVGSNISTVFTLDGFDRVIKKESFDGAFTIQSESLTYSGLGNLSTSVTSGEISSNVTYQYDDETNPLKIVFEDNYLLQFLADDYSDEIGSRIAQYLSVNNWNGAVFDGESFTFTLAYNTVGRITNRDINYNFDDELTVIINERFTYLN
ncbi:MAG: hypothetical protein HKN40_00850, partial [Winogradskyella sp.]|uniref:hypothetical protein n=1 Tax=Winogradskyella sp. TaxID=1883156 RepID=UPI00179D1B88|nr:hypothetical protein [Winogradskyella sp.]